MLLDWIEPDYSPAVGQVTAGGTVSVVALILIAWLFSSSSWRELLQAAVAGAVGLLLHALPAAR